MVVYWGIFLWVFLLGRLQPSMSDVVMVGETREYRVHRSYMLLLFFAVIFFAAVRSHCIDTASYIREFNHLVPDSFDRFSRYLNNKSDSHLFYGIQALFKCFLSDNVHLWLGLIAVVQGLLVASVFRRYSPDFAISTYIFVASTLFTWMYNGIRQFLAVAIIFAATEWVLKNRWYLFVPLVLVLSGLDPICSVLGVRTPIWCLRGVHQSAIIMLPILFLVQGRAWNKKVWLLVGFLLAAVATGALDTLLGSAAENTTYAVDLANAANDSGSSPIRLLVALVPVALAFFGRREIYQPDTPPVIHLCVNMSVVTACLYLASMLTSGIYVGRLPIYCELYNLILLPWLIEHPFRRNRGILRKALMICYLLYFIFQMYFSWDRLTYGSNLLGIYLWGGTG